MTIDSNLPDSIRSDKKAELEKLRDYKVRSRIQWLQQGEKPFKYFCNLENCNFTDKTFQNIFLDNGTVVTEQEPI